MIDDGSPDKSGEICDSFAQQDHRIYVIHSKNGGVSRARNKGIEQAKGQFILFIDADDELFDNTTLEYIAQNIQNIQADIYQYIMSVSQQGKLNPIQNIQKLQCLDINTYRNTKKARGNAASYVFRNDLIQKYHIRFPEGVRISEDQAFTYSYFVYCDHIVLLPRPCYIYYVDENPNNSSKSRKNYSDDIRHHLNAIAHIIAHLNICKKNEQFINERIAMMILYFGNLTQFISYKDIKSFNSLFKQKIPFYLGLLRNNKWLFVIAAYIDLRLESWLFRIYLKQQHK